LDEWHAETVVVAERARGRAVAGDPQQRTGAYHRAIRQARVGTRFLSYVVRGSVDAKVSG